MPSYSIATLAGRWDCDKKTVRRMIKSGQLQTFQIGVGKSRQAIRVLGESIEAVERGNQPKAAAPTKRVPTPSRKWV